MIQVTATVEDVNVVGVIQDHVVTVVGTDLVGLQGPQGPPGGTITKMAAANIGGQRVLAFTPTGVVHADPTNQAHRFSALAVSEGAASTGTPVTCLTAGEVTELAWSWTPGLPVFVGVAGVPTQVLPVAPSWQRQIGTAITPTTIFLQFHPTTILI